MDIKCIIDSKDFMLEEKGETLRNKLLVNAIEVADKGKMDIDTLREILKVLTAEEEELTLDELGLAVLEIKSKGTVKVFELTIPIIEKYILEDDYGKVIEYIPSIRRYRTIRNRAIGGGIWGI